MDSYVDGIVAGVYEEWLNVAIPALEASIAHWERIASGTTVGEESMKSQDCACCEIWIYKSGLDPCTGCPISLDTGRDACTGTPYEVAYGHFMNLYLGDEARNMRDLGRDDDEITRWALAGLSVKEAATEEVGYLRSVLSQVKEGLIRPMKKAGTDGI